MRYGKAILRTRNLLPEWLTAGYRSKLRRCGLAMLALLPIVKVTMVLLLTFSLLSMVYLCGVHAGRRFAVSHLNENPLPPERAPSSTIHNMSSTVEETIHSLIGESAFTVSLNDMVIDFALSVTHTSIFHSYVMASMSDINPFISDPRLPLIVSWRERERLFSQYKESLLHESKLRKFTADVMGFVVTDHRTLSISNVKGVEMDDLPYLKVPFASVSTVDELKRSVVLYSPPTSSKAYIDSLIDLIVTTGVEEVVMGVPSSPTHPHPVTTFNLAPPLVIHLPPCEVNIFARYALMHPSLSASVVKRTLKQWKAFKSEVEVVGGGGGSTSRSRSVSTPPRVPRRIIITTTDLDDTPTSGLLFSSERPSGLTPNAFVHELLDHPLLVHWYAQNCNIRHHKFSCIPIGINFIGGSRWNKEKPTPIIEQQNLMMWMWFLPRDLESASDTSSQEEPNTSFHGSHRHPADNLQGLLESVMGVGSWSGEGTGSKSVSFAWHSRLSRQREARLHTREIGCMNSDEVKGCKTIVEDVVPVEMLEHVLAMPTGIAGESKTRSTWVRYEEVGAFVRKHYGGDVVLKARIVAPRLSVVFDEVKNTSSGGKACVETEWSSPDSPPLECQLHYLRVTAPRESSNEVELLISVPAVFFIALHHYRSIGSLEYRQMRISTAFEVNNMKPLRRGVERELTESLGSAVDTTGKQRQGNQYYESLQSNLFTASPAGFGYDCYRTYESLLMGSIPILFRPSLFSSVVHSNAFITHQSGVDVIDADAILDLYQDLPIILVDSYSLSFDEMEEWRADVERKLKQGAYKWEKLFSQYWMERIGSQSSTAERLRRVRN